MNFIVSFFVSKALIYDFILQSNKIDRLVKPAVLSCFGDVALAIGPNFTRYYEYVMAMLVMALSTAKVEDPVGADMIAVFLHVFQIHTCNTL